MLKYTGLLLVVLLSAAGHLSAQDFTFQENGYGFFAAGSAPGTATMHFGAGYEMEIYKGLGVGGEIGYLTPFSDFGDGIGVFSPNGVFQFRIANDKFTPYITGGYSLGFRSGHIDGFNFGGGTHYWFGEKTALRFEFRDQVFDFGPTMEHYYGFRIGLSFR
jgi:hypothetical protein